MIYISFNDSSLLCTVIAKSGKKPLLTHCIQLPLTGNLDDARGNDKVFNSILEEALRSLSSEIQLDGHQAYITIPDYWVLHDFTDVDPGMNTDDSWDFILWQKEQRLGEKSQDYITYAENIQENLKHVIHVPTLLVSDIKLTISEYGADPVWFGTESMTFTGSTRRTYGVISESGSGYDLFVVKRKNLYAGSLRNVKGTWNVSKSFGFKSSIEDLLTIDKKNPRKNFGPVFSLDELSDKKKAHWINNRLKMISPFSSIIIENKSIYENASYHLMAVQSILMDESFVPSAINILSAQGLVEKGDKKVEEPITKRPKKEKKPVPKKKILDLQNVVVFITTLIILLSFGMSVYLNMSEKPSAPKISNDISDQTSIVETAPTQSIYPRQLEEILWTSLSIKNSMRFVYESFPFNSISFLSASEKDLQLEIVNGEDIEEDLVALGSMVNYNVQGIDCCGGFKHFYDFRLPESEVLLSSEIDSDNSVQASISNMNILTEKFEQVDKGTFKETRFIMKADSQDKMKSLFSNLSTTKHNVALRKVIVRTDPVTGDSKSVFYISVYEPKNN